MAQESQHLAFISYSRKNTSFARDLERALRGYRPPKESKLPSEYIRVFRDESDFTGTDYVQAIRKHLAASRKLIVVCSPEAAASRYVDDEIAQFARIHGPENIIPVLLSGVPNNEMKPGEESLAAFPPALLQALEMPLAIDYRGYEPKFRNPVRSASFGDRWYSLLANLLDVSRDEIERREIRRKARVRNYWISGTTAVILALSTATVWALISRAEAVRERRIATAHELATRTETIRGAQTDVAERRALLAAEAVHRLRSVGAPAGSAEATLADAMSRLPLHAFRIPVSSNTPVIAFSRDGTSLFHSAGNRLTSWNLHTGEMQANTDLGSSPVDLVMSPSRDTLVLRDSSGRLEFRNTDDLSLATVATDGVSFDSVACAAFNSAGTLLAVLDKEYELDGQGVHVLRTSDWKVHAEFDVPPDLAAQNGIAGPCLAFRPDNDDPETLVATLRRPSEPKHPITAIAWHIEPVRPGRYDDLLERFADRRIGRPEPRAWDNVRFVRFSAIGKKLLIVDDAVREFTLSGWTEYERGQVRFPESAAYRQGRPVPDLVSPDGRYFLSYRSIAEDPYVPLLGTSQVEIRRTHDGAQLAEVPASGAIFTNDSSALLTRKGTLLRVWSVSDGREIYRLNARQNPTEILESPDGQYLAIAADDGSVDVWNIGHPQEVLRTTLARFVSMSPDGRYLASGDDGWLEVLDIESRHPVARKSVEGIPEIGRWGPQGRYFGVTMRVDSTDAPPEGGLPAMVLDLQRGGELVWSGRGVSEMAISPHGPTIYVAHNDNSISAWSGGTRSTTWKVQLQEPARRLTVSRDGATLIAGFDSFGVGGPAVVIDPRSGDEITRTSDRSTLERIADSGRSLAIAASDGGVRILDLDSPETNIELEHPETSADVFGLAFVGDGSRLVSLAGNKASMFLGASFYTEQAAFVWDLETRQALVRVPGGEDTAGDYRATLDEEDKPYPVDLELSRDGHAAGATVYPSRWAYWGVSEQFVPYDAVVWDLRPPQPVEILRQPNRKVRTVSDDGRIVLLEKPGARIVWTTDRSNIQTTLCRRVSRSLTAEEQSTYLAPETYAAPCSRQIAGVDDESK